MNKLAADKFVGFVLPLPIFVDPSSSIVLANKGLGEAGVAVPVSVLLLPYSLCVSYKVFFSKIDRILLPFIIAITFFVSFFLMAGFVSAFTNPLAMVYALQWVLPFLWVPYFVILVKSARLNAFLCGFEKGSIISILYFAGSAFGEMMIYGGLQGGGRISQNLVFPGQYQLYVYTPTAIAYAVLFCDWIYLKGFIKRPLIVVFFVNLLALLDLILIAAREALVVYLCGVFLLMLFYSRKSFLRSVIVATTSFMLVVIIIKSFDVLPLIEELRLVNKFQSINDPDKRLAGRDEMVSEYISIIKDDPLIGLSALPPEISRPYLGVRAPSAHNYYVDVWAWGGVFPAIVIYILVSMLIVVAISLVFSLYLKGGIKKASDDLFLRSAGACMTILFLVISNNINVPLRQPLTGGMFVFFMTLMLLRRKSAV